ncbi:MAG TPA: DUF3175 domain-containing protein [Anaeromyxobacteraceae bacterium]|nr:DUF3175 domain-containing protein [Anaeromyxobacteraceae bacterium]
MAQRTSRPRTSARTRTGSRKTRRWSRQVTERSDALDLQRGVFKLEPRAMARSLKRSAERSARKKSSPFRSAMSLLTFFENRAGRNLPARRKLAIRKAKEELRKLFGREPRHA